MFAVSIPRRINLSSAVPRIVTENLPSSFEGTMRLEDLLMHFWSFAPFGMPGFSELDRASTDELVTVLMTFAVSDHFDLADPGVLEAGAEYFQQSHKVDLLFGLIARQMSRGFKNLRGVRGKAYPLNEVTFHEIYGRAERAIVLLDGLQQRGTDWEGDSFTESDNWEFATRNVRAMTDDELVDSTLLAKCFEVLERQNGPEFLSRSSFRESQLALGRWVKLLASEIESRRVGK